jgi:uncharacterized protein (DUF433 family)
VRNDPPVEMTHVEGLDRITFRPGVMQGQACIRGSRVTVSTIVDTIASGRTPAEILAHYPCLEAEDIEQALHFAAMKVRGEEYELQAS